MRRGLTISGAALLAGACSLFTDLGGFDEGADASVPDASSDVTGLVEDGVSSDAGVDVEPFVTPDAALDACPTVTPSNGLVAFYPLDEGQGTTITDCSPSKLHGSLMGSQASMKWVTGRNIASGSALELDGNGACFDLGGAALLDFAGKPFTASAWVRVRDFEDDANLARQIVSRENQSGGGRGWHLGTDNPFAAELDVITGDGGQREVSTSIVALAWTHVAATYDGAAMKIYVNGVFKNQNPGPNELGIAPSGAARLGCKKVGDHVFDGTVDDVRVYDRVLSDAEITTLAQP